MTGNDFIPLDDGRLTVAREFADVLRGCGLTSFAAVMAHPSQKVMRSVPGRSTVRVELGTGVAAPVAYLKRYEPRYLSPGKRLLRRLGWPVAQDEAMHEWRALLELRGAGFRTAAPIAVGQLRRGGLVTSSFLLTAEIAGGVPGDDYFRELDAPRRRELAVEVAELARRFHAAGFVHKDFYFSHVFVTPHAGRRELSLIDLQRVVRPTALLRPRWIVKDLGALGYTAQRAGASRGDLLRFYLRYAGKSRLDAGDRRFIRQVMARVNALHRRGPKYDVIWDQPGARPEVPNRR
jgi:hypothetical protein